MCRYETTHSLTLSCLSVRPSVCHTGVLCRNNGAQHQPISAGFYPRDSSLRTSNMEHITLGDPSSGDDECWMFNSCDVMPGLPHSRQPVCTTSQQVSHFGSTVCKAMFSASACAQRCAVCLQQLSFLLKFGIQSNTAANRQSWTLYHWLSWCCTVLNLNVRCYFCVLHYVTYDLYKCKKTWQFKTVCKDDPS